MVSETTKSNDFSLSGDIEANYGVGKGKLQGGNVSKNQAIHKNITRNQNTIQNLAKQLGERKCCWVLEDFDKMPPDEKKHLAQAMKLFMNTANKHNYSELKVIAVGAVNKAHEVVHYNRDMANRVAEIEVPLMTDDELRAIIALGEQSLNIEIKDEIKTKIVQISSGLASICHQLCLNLCLQNNIRTRSNQTYIIDDQDGTFKEAIEWYYSTNEQSLKNNLDKAFQANENHGKIVLYVLATQFDMGGATLEEICNAVQKLDSNYSKSSVVQTLDYLISDKLTPDGFLRLNSDRYSYLEPINCAFVQSNFQITPLSNQDISSPRKSLSKEQEERLKDLTVRFILNYPNSEPKSFIISATPEQ